MSRIDDRLNDIVNDKTAKVATANDMLAMLRNSATHLSNIVLIDDVATTAELKHMTAVHTKYVEAKEALAKAGADKKEKVMVTVLDGLMAPARRWDYRLH